MCSIESNTQKIFTILGIIYFLSAGAINAKAQKAYEPPRKSSETAKYEYENSHYPASTPGRSVNILVPTKNDAEVVQQLAKGADITADKYYADLIDSRNAEYKRNGILAPDKDGWKRIIENMKESEWPAKWPNFYYSIDSGYATVRERGRYGVIDTTGKIIIPIIWGSASIFHYGLSSVQNVGVDGKYGFMDKNNKLVIPLKYEGCNRGFIEGLAPVKLKGKWGYINLNDEVIIPFKYDGAENFRDGLAIVQNKKKYGVVDKNGQQKIEFNYQSLTHFTFENLFLFKLKDKYGVLDEDGNIIIEAIYSSYFSFFKNKAKVTLGSRTFYIDTAGKEVPAPL